MVVTEGNDQSAQSLDTSTFSVTGDAYNTHDEEESLAVKETHGNSKDHRPDLRQIVTKLIVSHDESVPLVFKAHDGNPNKNQSPSSIKYQITAKIEAKPGACEQSILEKACFVLGTNDLSLANDELINVYKSHFSVEYGFRFLKSSALWLKKTERIEALLMTMSLSLLV